MQLIVEKARLWKDLLCVKWNVRLCFFTFGVKRNPVSVSHYDMVKDRRNVDVHSHCLLSTHSQHVQNSRADWNYCMKRTMTQSCGWNQQRLQHSQNEMNCLFSGDGLCCHSVHCLPSVLLVASNDRREEVLVALLPTLLDDMVPLQLTLHDDCRHVLWISRQRWITLCHAVLRVHRPMISSQHGLHQVDYYCNANACLIWCGYSIVIIPSSGSMHGNTGSNAQWHKEKQTSK